MEAFSTWTGVPSVQLKAALVLVIAYPFALLFIQIPVRHRTLRHLYSIVISATLYCSLFSALGFFTLLASSLVVYALAWSLKSHGIYCALACFMWAMAHLSLEHWNTQVLGKGGMGTFDQSAPLMVLVIKLSSFGWCVYDGHRKVGGNTEASKSTGDLSPLQQRLAISPSSFPSLVEYMGYVFFFGGFLVGPAFEFSDYIRFINGEAPFEVEKMPSRVLPTLKCIVWALLCMGIFAMFSKRYNLALLVGGGGEDEGLVFSNSISRFAFIIVASAVARAKFYGAWKMSEGACVLAGVGYAGEGKWNRVENIRILDFELPENPKALSDSWNINTSLWLRNYVYVRVTGILGNGWAQYATNMTSAFWHGFHPGFYMFFGSASFFIMVARSARRHIRPLFLDIPGLRRWKWLAYDLPGTIITALMVGYSMVPFTLKEMRASLVVWGSVGYCMHVVQGLFYVWLEYGGGKGVCRRLLSRHADKKKREREREEVDVAETSKNKKTE